MRHAFYKYPHTFPIYADLFICCPPLWIAALFARRVPRTWLILLGVIGLQCLFLPVVHYVLLILPFLCIMAAMGYQNERELLRGWVLILLIFPVIRAAKDFILPWRNVFGMRAYGISDGTEMANVVKSAGPLVAPIWCSYPQLYFLMGWKPPTFDFINIAQIDDLGTVDLSKINTAIEALPYPYAFHLSGWSYQDLPLKRGQFTKLRIWRRNGK